MRGSPAGIGCQTNVVPGLPSSFFPSVFWARSICQSPPLLQNNVRKRYPFLSVYCGKGHRARAVDHAAARIRSPCSRGGFEKKIIKISPRGKSGGQKRRESGVFFCKTSLQIIQPKPRSTRREECIPDPAIHPPHCAGQKPQAQPGKCRVILTFERDDGKPDFFSQDSLA